jgi:hypothetical protein
VTTNITPNHLAAGKAGITSRLAIGRHWPGLPEPVRSPRKIHYNKHTQFKI